MQATTQSPTKADTRATQRNRWLVLAVLLPAFGRLGDIFGRKRLFILARPAEQPPERSQAGVTPQPIGMSNVYPYRHSPAKVGKEVFERGRQPLLAETTSAQRC